MKLRDALFSRFATQHNNTYCAEDISFYINIRISSRRTKHNNQQHHRPGSTFTVIWGGVGDERQRPCSYDKNNNTAFKLSSLAHTPS